MNTTNTNTEKAFNYPTLTKTGYYFFAGTAIINNNSYNFKVQADEITSLEPAIIEEQIAKAIMSSLRKNPLFNELQHFTVTTANHKF